MGLKCLFGVGKAVPGRVAAGGAGGGAAISTGAELPVRVREAGAGADARGGGKDAGGMTEEAFSPGGGRSRLLWLAAAALVCLGIAAAYSNSLRNGFHLDDM